jgi:histone-lysine N-methyltransferase SETMAR
LAKLSPENKERRCDTAVSLLTRFERKAFLYKIITGDEKWVLYDHRKSWVKLGQPLTLTPKPNIHAKKVLLCTWWDIKGVVYYELLESGQTVNSERYQQQLIRLSDELEQKRPFTGHGTRKVILQHDNDRPHITKGTKDFICSLGWEVLPHVAYSPDQAPSDYHLIRSLQHHLADTHSKTVEEARKSIDDLSPQSRHIFFKMGFVSCPKDGAKSSKITQMYNVVL